MGYIAKLPGLTEFVACTEPDVKTMLSVWRLPRILGTGERGHCERGLLVEESPESLHSLESLEDGGVPVCFPLSWGSLERF